MAYIIHESLTIKPAHVQHPFFAFGNKVLFNRLERRKKLTR